ncbi:hypothetical protein P4S72_18350 [Vibrio sp. PP-XX7]
MSDKGKIGECLVAAGPVNTRKTKMTLWCRKCLKRGQLVSLKHLSHDHIHQSRYQVVIPIMDVKKRIYAVVLIERIQFFSLNKKHINFTGGDVRSYW